MIGIDVVKLIQLIEKNYANIPIQPEDNCDRCLEKNMFLHFFSKK